MNMQRRCRNSAFTLIEITIVMAILMALTALSLSIISRVRENGRSGVCRSNLKQIALAIQQYVQDNDGRFPNDSWNYQIASYLRKTEIVRCPSRRRLVSDVIDSGNPLFAPDYLYNTARLSKARHSKSGSLLFEGEHESSVLNVTTTFMNADDDLEGFSVQGSSNCGVSLLAPTLHNGGGNFSFVDGHVKWMTPDEISQIECSNKAIP